jgi:hypothetical protein
MLVINLFSHGAINITTAIPKKYQITPIPHGKAFIVINEIQLKLFGLMMAEMPVNNAITNI